MDTVKCDKCKKEIPIIDNVVPLHQQPDHYSFYCEECDFQVRNGIPDTIMDSFRENVKNQWKQAACKHIYGHVTNNGVVKILYSPEEVYHARLFGELVSYNVCPLCGSSLEELT